MFLISVMVLEMTEVEEIAFCCGFMKTGAWNCLSWKPHYEIKGELREAGPSSLLLAHSTPAISSVSGPCFPVGCLPDRPQQVHVKGRSVRSLVLEPNTRHRRSATLGLFAFTLGSRIAHSP